MRSAPPTVQRDDAGEDAAGVGDAAELASGRVLDNATARPSFWRACWAPLIAGLAIRLVLAPFTSSPYDVGAWYRQAAEALSGLGMYQRVGFSYPPLWGYPLEAIGVVARWAGLGPQAFGVTSPPFVHLVYQVGSYSFPTITTLDFTVVCKLCFIGADVATGWLVWRAARRLFADERRARTACILWFLSPAVIFESAVHGAFDSIVALCIVGALVARLERRFVLCGVAVALGVLAKATPAYLLPLLMVSVLVPWPGERTDRRWRDLGGLVLGGIGTLVVVLAPLAAAGELAAMAHNVGARSSAPSTVLGGIGVWGVMNARVFASLAAWLGGDGARLLAHLTTALYFVASFGVAAAWALWRRCRGPVQLVAAAGVVFTAIVVLAAAPASQPRYVLWMLAPACILAAGRRWAAAACWVAGIGVLVFEIGTLGVLGYFAPLAVATHWLSPATVAAQIRSLSATPGVIGTTLGNDIRFFGCVVTVVGLVAVAVFQLRALVAPPRALAGLRMPTGTALPGAGPPGAGRAGARGRRRYRRPGTVALAVLAAGLVVTELVGALGPVGAGTTVAVGGASAPSSRGRSHVPVHVTSAPAPVRTVAFAAGAVPRVPHVAIFVDARYPTAGSSENEIDHLADDLQNDLEVRGDTRAGTVGASGLRALLTDRADAPQQALVMANGTLPSTVWGPHTDLVTPWLRAGGTLVWVGNPPGWYSAGPVPKLIQRPARLAPGPDRAVTSYSCHPPPPPRVVRPNVLSPGVTVLGQPGMTRLLGLPYVLTTALSARCVATQATPIATALELSFASVEVAPTLSQLRQVHGMALGYLHQHHSSISWIPTGRGGTVLFAGPLGATSAQTAMDMAQILQSGIVSARAQPAWVQRPPGGRAQLAVATGPAGSPAAEHVVVASFDAALVGSFFGRVVRPVPPRRPCLPAARSHQVC